MDSPKLQASWSSLTNGSALELDFLPANDCRIWNVHFVSWLKFPSRHTGYTWICSIKATFWNTKRCFSFYIAQELFIVFWINSIIVLLFWKQLFFFVFNKSKKVDIQTTSLTDRKLYFEPKVCGRKCDENSYWAYHFLVLFIWQVKLYLSHMQATNSFFMPGE